MGYILSFDVGTTAFKAGVFTSQLELIEESTRFYSPNVYDQGKADIDPELWWRALLSTTRELRPYLGGVDIVSLSVTTPGLVPMDVEGQALGPAILFFDQRSNREAKSIRKAIGEDIFISEACNLPVSGGSSLCSMLWIRENQPDIWKMVYKFGHTNTYLIKRLTGHWAIDPSTASITGLYHTRKDELTWIEDVLEKCSIATDKLPTLMKSYDSAGVVLPRVAKQLGLSRNTIVLCGGNDAVLAALSVGLKDPGQIINIAGTCEIIAACTDKPIGAKDYNIRCHVLPHRWVTFFVLNTGGKALEWFHSVFCRDMTEEQYYKTFIPQAIELFVEHDLSAEGGLPKYRPYLQGSRYSLDNLTAGFDNITLETTREKMLISLLRGNFQYLGDHLNKISKMLPKQQKIITTGGAANIHGMDRLRRRWMGSYVFEFHNQSSLLGAAMLGKMYLEKRGNPIHE
jgi:sugar (pentulose or hexulose) kinase